MNQEGKLDIDGDQPIFQDIRTANYFDCFPYTATFNF